MMSEALVRQECRGLGADDALLNATEQLLGLGERQPDLLELVMGLIEHQQLLVTGAFVTGIDPQPDLDLHVISSPLEFSAIRREESLNHACDARTWISVSGSG